MIKNGSKWNREKKEKKKKRREIIRNINLQKNSILKYFEFVPVC